MRERAKGSYPAKEIARKKGVHVITTKAEADFDFIVHERLGELSDDGRYVKELRVVEWGKYEPKFDIRPWATYDTNNRQMGKGITLTLDEIVKLKEVLDNIDLEAYVLPDKKIQPKIL